MTMDRRDLLCAITALGSAGVVHAAPAGEAVPASPLQAPATAEPASRPLFRIGMIIFNDMTNLDHAGPADVFARVRAAKVHVLAKSLDPVTTDSGGRVLPDLTFTQAPELDLLFIGGGLGPGIGKLMQDDDTLQFLRERAARAQWVTSVCTGALVLGAAGLLRGYRATTHWNALQLLPLLGATPVEERVVMDRNRITGGGVTAGIDFGLTVVARIWGNELAQTIQLGSEYNPSPPFNAGSPKTAPQEIVERFRNLTRKQTEDRRAAALAAAAKFQ